MGSPQTVCKWRPSAERFLQPIDPPEAEITMSKAPVEPIEARPSDEWLVWLASLSDTAISAILTWDGGKHDEDTQKICPTCGSKCSGERGLSIHLAQWCGVDKHRSQTIKRAEWATTTGNSLTVGQQKTNAKRLDHPMHPCHQHCSTDRRPEHRHQQDYQVPHPHQHKEHCHTSHR